MIPYSTQTITFLDAIYVAWQVKFKSLTQGNEIQKFENAIAKYVGSKYAVAVSSGTAGLHLAHLALESPVGAKVVTSPISFVASANSILYANQIPVFIDVDSHSGNMSPDSLEEIIKTNEIKTVVPVHYGGFPCDMQKIHEICKKNRINIIEDAAHALGASYSSGEKVGSCKYSDLTVFSFHPVKSVTTGEGGVITTNDQNYYEKLLQLRSHGIVKNFNNIKKPILGITDQTPNTWYYEMTRLGYHYRMTEIQAALGYSQMKKIDKFVKKRQKIAARYNRRLLNINHIQALKTNGGGGSANHLYVIKINFNEIDNSRNEIMLKLKESGVGSQVHYLPIPCHPFYQNMGYTTENLSNAMNFYFSILSIPIYPKLSFMKQFKVYKTLNKLLS